MKNATGINILKRFAIGNCVVKIASVEPLGAPGALDDALCQLSQYRRDKTLRYRYDKGKMLSAGAGLLLNNMLMERGLRERDMVYVDGEHGKPAFLNHPEIHFNLSHSDTLVACALSDTPVGVDVQHLVKLREGLVRYTMSDEEIAVFEALDNDDAKQLLFTQLWTLKESYAKATGRGLTHEFPSFEITETGEVNPLTTLTPCATFKLIRLPNAVSAVAVINDGPRNS